MRFYDFSPEKREEYMRRIRRVKATHPGFEYSSEHYWDMVTYCLSGTGIKHIKDADEMKKRPDLMGLREWILSSKEPSPNLIKSTLPYLAPLGDTKLCDRVFQTGMVDINAKDKEGNTGLMNAVQRKRLGTAEWLLNHGAKILPNKRGWNPVLWACRQGCIPALNMFKHYGVDFNQPVVAWEWWGMKGKHCRYILPKKIQVYPIMVALCQPKALQWLIDNGASIDVRYSDGKSLRDLLNKKGVLRSEAYKILGKKAAQTPAPVQQPKPSFWKRLSFGQTKE